MKRKRAGIRKSQISGPVDLDECDPATPEVRERKLVMVDERVWFVFMRYKEYLVYYI